MQEESKSFYEILKAKDPNLTSQLDLLRKRGFEMWLPMIHFDRGSHSGYPHIRNVERNADKMIPGRIKEKFEAGEIFLLLSAIFLHDIGKVVIDSVNGTSCPSFSENFKCDHTDKVNNSHCSDKGILHIYHCEKIIRDSWGMLGLPDERIAEYCATIAYCHGLSLPPNNEGIERYPCSRFDDIMGNYKNTSLEPYGRLRIPFLTSILRLADEADNCWMRSISPFWLKNISEDSFNTLVKSFRRWVEDVEFCHEGRCIIMHIPEMKNQIMEKPFGDPESESLTRCKNDIQKVLKEWLTPLNDEGIYYDHVFFEYENRFYNDLIIETKFKEQRFIDIFENNNETKETVRGIVKGVIKLKLGSLGYDRFRWRSLEAFVNHPLTDYDKWLARCLGAASGGKLKIEFIPGDDEHIRVAFNESKIAEIYEEFDIEEG